MPNRSTLMTGRPPSLHGVRYNGIPLSLEETTFPEVLRAHGFHTALIGKSHLQSMTMIPAEGAPGPDETATATSPPYALREARHRDGADSIRYEQENPVRWRDPEHRVTLPFYGFDTVDLCIGHGDRVGADYARWLIERLPEADRLRGPGGAAASEIVAPHAWRTRIPEEFYPTTYVADRTIATLEGYAAGGDGRPFFVECSFPDPHHPFTPPGRYWSMYDAADVPLPPSFRSADRYSPPHLRAIQDSFIGGTTTRNPPMVHAVNEREARECTALTYGMVALIDDCVGRIVKRLTELGFGNDTVIIFTSDHGDFMGDHQLLLKGPLHYQGLIRTPFIWADPNAVGAGGRGSALAGTIDIGRTILDRAGLEAFNGMQGRSLLPAMAATDRTPREAFLVEDETKLATSGLSSRARLRTVVTNRYRLSVYADETWGELYDFESDPFEMINRWDDPAYAGVRSDLAIALVHEVINAADTSPYPRKTA